MTVSHKHTKFASWVEDGCPEKPELHSTAADLDPEGVDAGMPVNILPAHHFIYDEGVFDQSAWAALVPGLQEAGADWAIGEEAGPAIGHADSFVWCYVLCKTHSTYCLVGAIMPW